MTQSIFSKEMEETISEDIVSLIRNALEVLVSKGVKQEYFRPVDASTYCGASEGTIKNWEDLGLSPIIIRGIKLYMKSDLDAFIIKHKIGK